MEHLDSPLGVERDDVVGPLQGSSERVVEGVPMTYNTSVHDQAASQPT